MAEMSWWPGAGTGGFIVKWPERTFGRDGNVVHLNWSVVTECSHLPKHPTVLLAELILQERWIQIPALPHPGCIFTGLRCHLSKSPFLSIKHHLGASSMILSPLV